MVTKEGAFRGIWEHFAELVWAYQLCIEENGWEENYEKYGHKKREHFAAFAAPLFRVDRPCRTL